GRAFGSTYQRTPLRNTPVRTRGSTGSGADGSLGITISSRFSLATAARGPAWEAGAGAGPRAQDATTRAGSQAPARNGCIGTPREGALPVTRIRPRTPRPDTLCRQAGGEDARAPRRAPPGLPGVAPGASLAVA